MTTFSELWGSMVADNRQLMSADATITMTSRELLEHVERAYVMGEKNGARVLRDGLRRQLSEMIGVALPAEAATNEQGG